MRTRCPMYKSETRVDIALLTAALFLQRFEFTNSGYLPSITTIVTSLIFAHQFATGRLLIQYDRLLWFLLLGLAATSSLYFNFQSTRLASYGMFLVNYFFFTLIRPSSSDRYIKTLQGCQFLILIIACLGTLQFLAQFVINGKDIIMFFGIIPDVFLNKMAIYAGPHAQTGANTIIPISGSSLIKSNGIFLLEPSTLSAMMALAIVIEVLVFRRLRYLILLALGLLLSYSGTGIAILLVTLPLMALVHARAQLPALLIAFFALTLLGTGIIDASVFTSRIGEFQDVHGSGFMRFISPFWMIAEYFNIGSLRAWIFGNGPATMKEFNPLANYSTGGGTWIKLLYEYGLLGFFVFTCFLATCFRGSRCPKPVIAALIYYYIFTGDALISTPILTMMIVLCTLNGPEPRQGHIEETAGPLSYPGTHSTLTFAYCSQRRNDAKTYISPLVILLRRRMRWSGSRSRRRLEESTGRRSSFARMAFADWVQTNGFERALCSAR